MARPVRSGPTTVGERATAGRRSDRGDRPVNAWLTGAAIAVHLFALLVLPLWLLPLDGAWGWLLVPLVLVTTPFWSLIHEAIHGTLAGRRTRNDRSGRVLSVLFGAPFALLKAGHLLHHRYSRTQRERSEVYDPATTSWVKVAPGYYLRLIGGLYLLEVAAVTLALLPAAALRRLGHRLDTPDTVAGLLVQRIAQGKVLRQFRIDSAAIVALYAGAFLAYGRYWWMLLVALAGRAFVVSVSDNAYHYGTRLEATLEAMNLRLPRSLQSFALSFTWAGSTPPAVRCAARSSSRSRRRPPDLACRALVEPGRALVEPCRALVEPAYADCGRPTTASRGTPR